MWIRSLLLITILVGSVIGSTMAYFSDSETSSNNTFSAGSIDLLVNGQNNPSGIVNLDDLKPGDIRTVNKTLEVSTNQAEVFMHILDLLPSQGQQSEPENVEENGTPKFDLENYIGYSLQIDGAPIIATTSATLLAQASSCYIPLGVVNPNDIVEMQQIFSLPSSVTNWAQGDTLSFTEDFLAQQTRNNPIDPITNTGRLWNSELQKCELCSFTSTEWLSSFESYSPGPIRSGGSVPSPRNQPINSLGINNGPANGTFVSLGFGGNIVVKFPVVVADEPGNDLKFFEITGGVYPAESAIVEISADNSNWYSPTVNTITNSGGGVALIDVNGTPLAFFQYVRITDNSNTANFPIPEFNSADGYDLDAVQAFHGKSCTSALN